MASRVTRLGVFSVDDEIGTGFTLTSVSDRTDGGVLTIWADGGVTTWSVLVYGLMTQNDPHPYLITSLTHLNMDANRSASTMVQQFPFFSFVFNGATGTAGRQIHLSFME